MQFFFRDVVGNIENLLCHTVCISFLYDEANLYPLASRRLVLCCYGIDAFQAFGKGVQIQELTHRVPKLRIDKKLFDPAFCIVKTTTSLYCLFCKRFAGQYLVVTSIDIDTEDGRVYGRQGVYNLCVFSFSAQTCVFQLSFSLCLLLVLLDYSVDDLKAGYDVSAVIGFPKIKLVVMQLSALCAAVGAVVFALRREHLAKGLKGKRLCNPLPVLWIHVFLYPLLYDRVVGKLVFSDSHDGFDVVVIRKAHHSCRAAVEVCHKHVFEVSGQRVDDCDLLCQRLVLLLLLAYHLIDVIVVPAKHESAFYRLCRTAAAHISLAQNGVLPEIEVLITHSLFHLLDAVQNQRQRVFDDVLKPCVIGFLGCQLLVCNTKKPQHEVVCFHRWSLSVNQGDAPCSHL